MAESNPTKLCECGCGMVAPIATRTHVRYGWKKGQPMPRIIGHWRREEKTPTRRSWEAMLRRCRKPSFSHYHHYGGRGITVCERWAEFENFLADMGERPDGTSLDRIDSNGNYEPHNCRWATKLQQANNTRRNVEVTYQGRRMNLTQWSRCLGISRSTLYNRYLRAGDRGDKLFRPVLQRD